LICPMTILTRRARVCCATGTFLVLWLMIAAARAQDFTYTNDNGSITITGYSGPAGDVTIPSTINGLPVTSIGASAFITNTFLVSVRIPSSVTNIGDGAFEQCVGLTSVTIADGLTTIGNFVFVYCFGLTNVTFPSSIANIKTSAFNTCYKLTNVTIPYNVTNIGIGALAHYPSPCSRRSGTRSVQARPSEYETGDSV